MAGANCDSTWFGDKIGFWDFDCLVINRPDAASLDEVQASRVLQREGSQYAEDHLSSAPRVAALRVLRTWGLYHGRTWWEGRAGHTAVLQTISWLWYLTLLVLAVVGGLRLRRNRTLRVMLIAVVVEVLVVSIVFYGNQRLRITAEPFLLICAAATLADLADALAGRQSASQAFSAAAP